MIQIGISKLIRERVAHRLKLDGLLHNDDPRASYIALTEMERLFLDRAVLADLANAGVSVVRTRIAATMAKSPERGRTPKRGRCPQCGQTYRLSRTNGTAHS